MIKFITELAPLVAFFIGYKSGGIQVATLYTIIASATSLIIYFTIYKKIEKITLISSGILIITGLITVATDNPVFIKFKPTLLYSLFALTLLISTINNKPILKYFLGPAITLKEDRAWKILSLRFVFFFIGLAIANEIIWRFYSEKIWVNFKVFYVLPITILFIITQIPFLMKNKV